MRVQLGIVSETTEKFLNQVKLCLFSLRKNGGALKNVPVTLITNSESLNAEEQEFFQEHFSPIEFKTSPRLGAIPHTSKLNVLYAIEPSSYDVLIYMDCDTVVSKPLDGLIDPIQNEGAEFVCRRGGLTDRNRFIHFDRLVAKFCGPRCSRKISFEGTEEWPMFNSGVFLATPEAVLKIRKDTVEFTYRLFNKWQRTDARENLLPCIKLAGKFLYRYRALGHLYRLKILTRQDVMDSWPLEQGALALACIKSGIEVHYLDEIYNSWGGTDDFRILHCFKSLYKFDRHAMFSGDSEPWIKDYLDSDIPGKIFLAKLVREYKQTYPETLRCPVRKYEDVNPSS